MNKIKKHFSIKDLENLSGIKAHTIRIWEKRYNLLSPSRTKTNIRYYSSSSLQKLLNIVLLYKNGHKISEIAKIEDEKIPTLTQAIIEEQTVKNQYINMFKLAMFDFDMALFSATYNDLLSRMSFTTVFNDVFIPLLHKLGLLWQTDTITPAHEHFITNLIQQKIIANISKLQAKRSTKKQYIYVLYLPENETHDIGLLYLNYETLLKGYPTIYLGQTVPIKSLKDITTLYPKIIFVSYFTVEPRNDRVNTYIKNFERKINTSQAHKLWILGRQAKHVTFTPPSIRVFKSPKEFVKTL